MINARKGWVARVATWAGAAALALATTTGSAPVVIAPVAAEVCTIIGTQGDDVLVGTPRADVICGLGGDDRISGRGGDDRIFGGRGDDVLLGGAGDDVIHGRDGNDRISGGDGDDVLRGWGGRDVLTGGPGDDTIYGGSGADTLIGGGGTDRLLGRWGNDFLDGVDAAGTVDRIDCGDGARDRVRANGTDVVRACESRDILGPSTTQHPPVAVPDTFATTEDVVLVLPLTGTGSPAANDTDADGGPLTVTAVQGATGGTAVIAGGEIRFTPEPDLCGDGAGSFGYTVSDPTGRKDTGHVTVDIACVPDEPVAHDDDLTVTEDAVDAVLAVTANDVDADGDDLEPTVRTDPSHGTVAVADGVVTYTPDADYCNTPPGDDPDAFTYSLTPTGTTATVTLAVTCVDDAPVAQDDSFLLDEDDAATALTVLANDTDVDGGAISVSGTTDAGHGTVTVTGGGTGLTYAPDADYCNDGSDPDTFDYTLAPGGSTATVSVAVTCVVDSAEAVDDEVTVGEDAAATAVDVLSNDVLGDGAAPTVTAVTQGAHGTVVLEAGAVSYTPAANYCNVAPDTDSFDYTISGGSSATVTVHVTCVNDAPTAAATTFDAARAAVGNTTLVVDDPSDGAPSVATPHKTVTGDLLAGATDVETPGSVAVVADTVTTDLGGSVTLEADGDFTYAPPAGCSGTADTFTYELTDGDATGQAEATVEFSGCVWYVDNDAAGDSGTSSAPFDTIAEAVAAAAVNQTIHVARGDGSTVGYDAGVLLKNGQRLVGSAVDLSVGGYVLAAGDAGERPTITRSGGDVVTLATGNLVTGLQIDPSGAGSGVAGGAGAADAAVADVRIIDEGVAGTEPAFDLDGTTGTSTVSDLTVDATSAVGATSGSVGVRLNNAGTVTLVPTGTITIRTTGARGLVVSGTALGSSGVDEVTVAGSSTGAVALSSAGGSLTFGDLALTTTGGAQAAFAVQGSGTVTVPPAATATISATGGPAVDVTGTTGAILAFDSVSSSNSTSDGINLAGLGTGTFSATGGTLGGAAGIAFDLDGGSGVVTYGGSIADGTGASADITSRSGGTVTLGGTIADGSDPGGGVTVSANTGGSTVLSGSSKSFSTGASTAVAMTTSDGHALRITNGGLDVTTTTGKGVDATGSGTLVISGAANRISSGAARALGVVNTDIGSAGVVLERVDSSGATNGIVLDGTGTAGSLSVTGTGSSCVPGNVAGCTGGTITGTTGADDASVTPVGTGIVLHDTQAPSLSGMRLNTHANYAIRGDAVRGLTIANSVVDGTNGTNGVAPYDDSSILLTNLTGSASITDTVVRGGLEDNLRVANTTGSLDRLTLDGVTFPVDGARPANDAVSVESTSTAAALKVTVTDSTIASAAGDLLQVAHAGSGAGDVLLTGNTFSNGHPSIATGGGGVSLYEGGGAGATTMNVTGNQFRDAAGPAVLVVKDAGASVQQGTFATNTIGTAGQANSGSTAGSGLVLQTVGGGTSTWSVTNNQVRGYNNYGVYLLAGGGASAQSGAFNTTITGNTIAEPGTLLTGFSRQGIHANVGTVPGDTFAACTAITGNTLAGSGADTVTPIDVRLRQRQGTTIRLPGYGGTAGDDTAVQAYLSGANTGSPVVSSSNTFGSGGGGFTGGAPCPTPAP